MIEVKYKNFRLSSREGKVTKITKISSAKAEWEEENWELKFDLKYPSQIVAWRQCEHGDGQVGVKNELKEFIHQLLVAKKKKWVEDMKDIMELSVPRTKVRSKMMLTLREANFVRWTDDILHELDKGEK